MLEFSENGRCIFNVMQHHLAIDNINRFPVPGILNFAFSGQEGEAIRLLLMLDEEGISVLTGSTCSSNHTESNGSHILKAIGRNPAPGRRSFPTILRWSYQLVRYRSLTAPY